MSAASRAAVVMARVDAWFRAPEPNAAGRMGLYRILFGLFYLWHLSIFDLSILSGMPGDFRRTSIHLFDWLPRFESPLVFSALDGLLVAALVLLILGLRTRAVTLVVLIAGVVREALLTGVDLENSNVFLVFYIPLFMFLASGWGDTYSIDASRRRQSEGNLVEPSDDNGAYYFGARAVLVILALLFTTSPLFKSLGSGTWLSVHDLLSNLMLQRSVRSVELGLTANPFAPWLASHPPLPYLLQLGILAFEGSFFLALFHRDWRDFYLALAMIFHSINAFFLVVSFTPILIVYGLFVDWEGCVRRFGLEKSPLTRIPAGAASATALVAAISFALFWNSGGRELPNLWGLLDWRSMWVPILPLAIAWAVRSARRILRRAHPE
jgi:hypothetical protein